MASPQIENGHVKIASELIEALARVNLRPYEWRVLLFVVRKTYGWKKKLDYISVSQIAQGTGLHKQHTSRARLTLLEKRLLIEDGGKIGLNKDYDQWQITGRKVTGTGYGVTDLSDAKVTDLGGKVTGTGDKTSPKQAPQKHKATNKSKRARAQFQKPSSTEVTEYAESIGFILDGKYFFDTYEARGWMVGRYAMKDWRAVVRTWRARDEEKKAKSKSGGATALPPVERGPDGLTPGERERKRIAGLQKEL